MADFDGEKLMEEYCKIAVFTLEDRDDDNKKDKGTLFTSERYNEKAALKEAEDKKQVDQWRMKDRVILNPLLWLIGSDENC